MFIWGYVKGMQKPFYDSKSKSYIQKDIIRDTLLYFILVNPIPFSSFSSPYLVFGLSLISFVRMNRYLLFSSLFSLHERWLLYIFFGTFFFILQHVLENTPYQLYSSFFFFLQLLSTPWCRYTMIFSTLSYEWAFGLPPILGN